MMSFSVFMRRKGINYWITLVPAVFMTVVCGSYILYDKIGFGLGINASITGGMIISAVITALYFIFTKKTALPEAKH